MISATFFSLDTMEHLWFELTYHFTIKFYQEFFLKLSIRGLYLWGRTSRNPYICWNLVNKKAKKGPEVELVHNA